MANGRICKNSPGGPKKNDRGTSSGHGVGDTWEMVQTQEKVYSEACNESTGACVYFGVLVVPAPVPLLQNGGLKGDFGDENSSKVRVGDDPGATSIRAPSGLVEDRKRSSGFVGTDMEP